MKKLCWVILVRTNIPECRLQGEINYKRYKESNGKKRENWTMKDFWSGSTNFGISKTIFGKTILSPALTVQADKVDREDCL